MGYCFNPGLEEDRAVLLHKSPLGILRLEACGGMLCVCRRYDGAGVSGGCGGQAVLLEAARQLDEYFAGTRRGFDLPLRPGGTAFQQEVWRELLRIPYGATVTYGLLARRVGRPGSVRAVAGVCNANPLAVIVPCHRVLGVGGRLTGYAGGLDMKEWLLRLEQPGFFCL